MYSSLVEIIKVAIEIERVAPFEDQIRFTTFDSVFRHIAQNQSEKVTMVYLISILIYTETDLFVFQPFKVEPIDLEAVSDFPCDNKDEFLEVIGETSLVYRNVRNLAEKLFAHPLFNDVTRLLPSTVTRDGERVYNDIYSGQWWHNMQVIYN